MKLSYYVGRSISKAVIGDDTGRNVSFCLSPVECHPFRFMSQESTLAGSRTGLSSFCLFLLLVDAFQRNVCGPNPASKEILVLGVKFCLLIRWLWNIFWGMQLILPYLSLLQGIALAKDPSHCLGSKFHMLFPISLLNLSYCAYQCFAWTQCKTAFPVCNKSCTTVVASFPRPFNTYIVHTTHQNVG